MEKLEQLIRNTRHLIRSSNSFDSAVPGLLGVFGTELEWDWGTYWKVDRSAIVLRATTFWKRAPDINTDSLEQNTRARQLSLSEGLAGQVWRHRKVIWSGDLMKDMCLPRSLHAQNAGLRHGVWFAVKTESDVYGVFEFLGLSASEMVLEMLVEIEHCGVIWGYELAKSEPGI